MIRRGKEKETLILGLTSFDEGYNVALARRLMAIAAEDIRLANPPLVRQVHAVASAFIIGKKENKSGFVEWNPLGLLIMLMCRSPKNREVDDAWIVLTDKLKSGEESAGKVISENYSAVVDGYTDEGKDFEAEPSITQARSRFFLRSMKEGMVTGTNNRSSSRATQKPWAMT
jgi:replication-associated recombination protein RarA